MWKNFVSIESPLVEYTRDRQNNKIGVLISGIIDNEVVIGWSLCNRSAGDVFDKTECIDIAEGRAYNNDRYLNNGDYYGSVPESLEVPMIEFVARIKKYYKNTRFSKFTQAFDI